MLDIEKTIENSIKVKSKMFGAFTVEIKKASELMLSCVLSGKKIIWCGNGGSAADSQHMSAELMGGLRDHSRPPIHSIALTVDTSFITAWANDISYESIFSRQIEAIGKPGDVLVAISTSGNSKNVLKAIKSAIKKSIKVIILTGKNGGEMSKMGDVILKVPSSDTQRIQESHLLIEHIFCEYVESGFIKSL